jgi:DNA-binding NtrC family response regulator
MPPDLQVKLLRVLESGVVRRVGSEESTTVDVRMLAATNRHPDEAVEKGLLRQDLFYRLKVFQLALPPLRQRPEDIDPLVDHFLEQFAKREGETKTITAATRDLLRKHPWPGNVRELRNVLYSAYVLADREITPDVLPPEVRAGVPRPRADDTETLVVQVGTPLADVTRRLVLATLAHHQGNKTRAAETLGISLKTLYARLADYRAHTGEAGPDIDELENT